METDALFPERSDGMKVNGWHRYVVWHRLILPSKSCGLLSLYFLLCSTPCQCTTASRERYTRHLRGVVQEMHAEHPGWLSGVPEKQSSGGNARCVVSYAGTDPVSSTLGSLTVI
jgi:hypothetical protein